MTGAYGATYHRVGVAGAPDDGIGVGMAQAEPVAGCLFCSIVAGQVPATPVGETPTTVAFRDVNPQAPTHVLVVPREHHEDMAALTDSAPGLAADLMAAAVAVARQEGLGSGYRLVLNTGPDAGQSVQHVHVHVLGGRGLSWPPG